MKYFTFIFFLGLFSCNGGNLNKMEVAEINVDTIGIDSIDAKLKIQLVDYFTAVNGGDADKAVEYCYPDMFVYMQREYPKEYTLQKVKDNFMKTVDDMKKSLKKSGMKYKYEIGEITQRIDLGERKIYTVVASIIATKDFDEYKQGNETIGITNDGGITWKFLGKDSLTSSPILQMKFSDKVVKRVFEKRASRN